MKKLLISLKDKFDSSLYLLWDFCKEVFPLLFLSIFALIVIIPIIAAILFTIVQFININFQNIPVKCYVDNTLIYDGISAGIETKTNGAMTDVTISGGFLYLFPKARYISSNVKLVGDKRHKEEYNAN